MDRDANQAFLRDLIADRQREEDIRREERFRRELIEVMEKKSWFLRWFQK